MRRFPWVSVALLVVLGLLAALAYPMWGTSSEAAEADAIGGFSFVYMYLGWASVGGALIIGALGVWARAPATLPTALGIVGAGAFAGVFLMQLMDSGDESTLNLGMVMAFTGVLGVRFSNPASLRGP